mgnify:CR=1 FL=1
MKWVGATRAPLEHGDPLLPEYDDAETLLREFVYGPGIDEPICLIDAADVKEFPG